jgi:ESS family glutamate:Na+ symporter
MVFELDYIQTMAAAVFLLFIGKGLKQKIFFLSKYCIPAPVIGGILFAIFNLFVHNSNLVMLKMDFVLKDVFMTAFFTTVGFTASLKLLKKGGRQLGLFLVLAMALVIMQNVVGVSLAQVFHLNPLIGLSTGSVPMTGGHGTAGAFAPIFEQAGAKGSESVAMAAATFGLVFGSLLGGPIAQRLIKKHGLMKTIDNLKNITAKGGHKTYQEKKLSEQRLSWAVFQIIIAMGIGSFVSRFLQQKGLIFPSYIGAMFTACVIRNIADTKLFTLKSSEIAILGDLLIAFFINGPDGTSVMAADKHGDTAICNVVGTGSTHGTICLPDNV